MTFSGKVRVTVVIGYTVTTGIKGERVASVWSEQLFLRTNDKKRINTQTFLVV